jgi:hypothetical protein
MTNLQEEIKTPEEPAGETSDKLVSKVEAQLMTAINGNK